MLLPNITKLTISKKSKQSKLKATLKGLSKQATHCKKESRTVNNSERGLVDFSVLCAKNTDKRSLSQDSKLIKLIDIESSDCDTNYIMSRKNKNLFFVESSGRNHLTPKDACAIESAVKNSGLKGHIIIAMTSRVLDITANNATCHIYSEHAGKNVFFRHVNVDTIFKDTPIDRIHLEGHLKHHEKRKEIVQYRYD